MQNVHPFFVHFPLALLLSAAVCEALYALTRRPLADTLSRWLLYLGAVAAGAAALTGWLGSLSVAPVAHAANVLVDHRTYGFVALGTAALLAFWRWGTAAAGGPRPRWLFAVGMLGLAGILVAAGLEGGDLVYEHGVGTRLTAPGGPLHETGAGAGAGADSLGRPKRDVPRSPDFH